LLSSTTKADLSTESGGASRDDIICCQKGVCVCVCACVCECVCVCACVCLCVYLSYITYIYLYERASTEIGGPSHDMGLRSVGSIKL